MQSNPYVEQRGEGWYIAGTRVSLDSIVNSFKEGLSPETISFECFPAVNLEQTYGAIAFYLGNRKEVDAYLREAEVKGEEWGAQQRAKYPELAEKMARARREFHRVG